MAKPTRKNLNVATPTDGVATDAAPAETTSTPEARFRAPRDKEHAKDLAMYLSYSGATAGEISQYFVDHKLPPARCIQIRDHLHPALIPDVVIPEPEHGGRGRAAPKTGETRSYSAQALNDGSPFVRLPLNTLGVAKTELVTAVFGTDDDGDFIVLRKAR